MLKIYEILDRFEILYPDNNAIIDLRRAYIDHDIPSIFRLIEHPVDSSDLRKVILGDDMWSLWRLLDSIVDTHFVMALKALISVNEVDINTDCFARGQLKSKVWLVSELEKSVSNLGTVFLCAGWYGTLATMLFESKLQIDKIRSFDIDETTVDIAQVFNKPWFLDDWRFKASVVDIMNFTWSDTPAPSDGTIGNFYYETIGGEDKVYEMKDRPDTIINTSCEHIENFTKWYDNIPDGKLVVLQSNNYFEIEDHINCSKDIDDFARITPMKEVLYSGELELEDYTRFMRIGYK